MESNRNVTIDICKGLGILLVVIGHLPNMFGTVIYSFHMGLFFMLSGWVFKDAYLDSKLLFIKKRFISIFLPFLIFRGISKLLHHTWVDYAAIEEKYSLIGTLWFLNLLFQASVISQVVLFLLRKVSKHYKLLAPILMLLVTMVVNIVASQERANTFYMTTFYLLGVYLRQNEGRLLRHKTGDYNSLLAVLGGVLLLLIVSHILRTSICYCNLYTYIPYIFSSVLGSWLILQLSKWLELNKIWTSPLIMIGRKTMPILLFQWPAFSLITILNDHVLHIVNENLLFVIKLVAGICIPLYLDYFYQFSKKGVVKLVHQK